MSHASCAVLDQWVLNFWGLYGLAAVGGRMLVHRLKTGSTGLRTLRSGQGGPERAVMALVLVALLLGPGATIADRLGWVHSWSGTYTLAVRWVGFALYLAGFALTLFAQYSLGDSWRLGVDATERTDLRTSGPFGLVRNPIFLGTLTTVLGLVLLLPSWLSVLSWLTWLAALELQVRAIEEPYLLKAHGDAFRHYAARVGRFVPGLGRLSPD